MLQPSWPRAQALEQFELAEQLTAAAYEKDPTPPITALYLSSRVASTKGESRERAFSELMAMIEALGPDSPQIVIAEAWNAAEDRRRYGDLLQAIDARLQHPEPVPSYLYVIRSEAVLRRSDPGSVEEAETDLRRAAEALNSETAFSQWYDSTLREFAQQAQWIARSKGVGEVPAALLGGLAVLSVDSTAPDGEGE